MIFVDTNYFLRFLLSEKSEQQKEAIELFKKGALGEVKLFTSTVVIFEVYWVLSTFYRKEKESVKEVLDSILKMDFVRLEEREILSRALDYLEELNYDLEDSYNLALALERKVQNFLTFDERLGKKFKTERLKVKSF